MRGAGEPLSVARGRSAAAFLDGPLQRCWKELQSWKGLQDLPGSHESCDESASSFRVKICNH